MTRLDIPAPTIEKTCLNCGQVFWATMASQRTCSQRCYKAVYRREHGGRAPAESQAPKQTLSSFDRPFMAWDGEGWDGKYTLLANSDDKTVYDPDGLSTVACLDFLLEYGQATRVHRPTPYNHIAFGFGYDVNMILRDVPLMGAHHSLQELHQQNWTLWKGYRIQYLPRKSFTVSKDGNSVTIYDTIGFFQSSFVKALTDWGLEPSEQILQGKLGRSEFATWDVQAVIDYNAEECTKLVQLMDMLREAMRSAGLQARRWDGAGALAAEWLRVHNATAYIVDLPEDVELAARHAYFGGRIELAAWGTITFRDGHTPRLWHWDIHSAYPWAMTHVPDLTQLTWKHLRTKVCPDEPFSLVHVRWHIDPPKQPHVWGALPWRGKSQTILYPMTGEGWYWAIEVQSALRRYPGQIDVLEAHVPEGRMQYPFREAIQHDYAERALRKRQHDPSNVVIKLALNSLYGKLAQKKGFNGKKPKFYNIAWAGFITAYARAMLNDAIWACHDEVVLCMTDALYAVRDMDPARVQQLGMGFTDALGDWEPGDEVSGEFIGAGLYATYDEGGNAKTFKQRGFGAEEIDYGAIIAEWEGRTPKKRHWTVVRRFIGMGIAIASREQYREQYRQFVEIPREIMSVPLHGTSKRMPDWMGAEIWQGLHWQQPWASDGSMSAPYLAGFGERFVAPENKQRDLFQETEG